MDPLWNQAQSASEYSIDMVLSGDAIDAFMPPPSVVSFPSNNQSAQLALQSEISPRLPLAGQQNEARTFTAKDWDIHQPEITSLYKGLVLPSVMKYMRETHGLVATPKQFKDRFSKWGIEKSIRPKHMKAMLKKKQERASEINNPKPSAFRLRGMEVTAKVDRYVKEHSLESSGGTIDADKIRNMSSAPTPGSISCYTPSNTGPRSPNAARSPHPSWILQGPASPTFPLSYPSNYSASYLFGDPDLILPGSPSVVDMSAGSYKKSSSSILNASSPSFVANIASSEYEFTGQSPASFSFPSTPRQQDFDIVHDEGMEVDYEEGRHLIQHQENGFFEGRAVPSSSVMSKPTMQSFLDTEEFVDHHNRDYGISGIHLVTPAGYNPMPLSEVYASMILSVEDALIVDRDVEIPKWLETPESRHQLTSELSGQRGYKTIAQLNQDAPQLGIQSRVLQITNYIVIVLSDRGRYQTAEIVLKPVLDQYKMILGKNHPEVLRSMDQMATVISHQGRYKTAEMMSREVLARREKVLGAEHHETLASLHNLAADLGSQGRYKAAEEMIRRQLKESEKVLENEHPAMLKSYAILALVLGDQGKYEAAKEIYQRVVEASEKVLGKEHPDTLRYLLNLAFLLAHQAEFGAAQKMFLRVLRGMEKVLGKEHPGTLGSVYGLAYVFNIQGKYEPAEQMARRALNGNEKVLGKQHPGTLKCNKILGAILDSQGKYEEAETMMQRALNGSEKVLGKEHPATLVCIKQLADLMWLKGQHQDALQHYQRALAGFQKVLGSNHPMTKHCNKGYLELVDEMKAGFFT